VTIWNAPAERSGDGALVINNVIRNMRIQSGVALRLPPHSKMRLVLISLLKFYKAVISPWLPPSCRFTPTCSEYAREAIERHGAFKGTGMAIWRLLRCQPFSAGGYDPVK
jgi:putative membrane protein insertion efficiency factor